MILSIKVNKSGLKLKVNNFFSVLPPVQHNCRVSLSHHSKVGGLGEPAGEGDGGALVGQDHAVVGCQEGHLGMEI